jgi:DNA-binding NarL/FixJ family response regulator
MSISILVADDHRAVRKHLHELLALDPDFRVVAEAASGTEAVALSQAHHPDIVLMDFSMPAGNGLEAAEAIRQQCPTTRVILVSAHANKALLQHALAVGVQGFLLKDIAGEEVFTAIRTVYQGESFITAATLE